MNYQGVAKFTEAKTLLNGDGDFRNSKCNKINLFPT